MKNRTTSDKLIGMLAGAEFIPGQHPLMVIYRELAYCDDESEQHSYLQTMIPVTADISLIERSLGEMEKELKENPSINSVHGFIIESITIFRDYLLSYRRFLENSRMIIDPMVMERRRRLLNALLPPARTKK